MFGIVIKCFADNCLINIEERNLITENKENADEHEKRWMSGVVFYVHRKQMTNKPVRVLGTRD